LKSYQFEISWKYRVDRAASWVDGGLPRGLGRRRYQALLKVENDENTVKMRENLRDFA
jgi:hypothetical protein